VCFLLLHKLTEAATFRLGVFDRPDWREYEARKAREASREA
jgi:hypothetical protein